LHERKGADRWRRKGEREMVNEGRRVLCKKENQIFLIYIRKFKVEQLQSHI
jgi:hypothetical protein